MQQCAFSHVHSTCDQLVVDCSRHGLIGAWLEERAFVVISGVSIAVLRTIVWGVWPEDPKTRGHMVALGEDINF